MANETERNEIERSETLAKQQSAKNNGKKLVGKVCAVSAAVVVFVVLVVLVLYTVFSIYAYGYSVQKLLELIALIILILVLAVVLVVWYIGNKARARKELIKDALKKSEQALSTVNLRYDNINEITAVMDVLDMVTDELASRAERKAALERLSAFIKADNFELPKTPETAAILDTLPAPDTPETLAAALSAGATLRQAEDGQTLVLTTISGGKNILLTPVQTSEGIILCQQGVRVRSDIAPNIENIGISSMPASPEFFEGLPLEKNVVYPELPQPTSLLNHEMLLSGKPAQSVGTAPALSAPQPVGSATLAAIGVGDREYTPLLEAGGDKKPQAGTQAKRVYDEMTAEDKRRAKESARLAYAQYREISTQLELRQVEELSALLESATPLTPEERAKIAEYKAAKKKTQKQREKKQRTPEQKAEAKAAAERRKLAQDAFLNALTPEDRDLYITEQKLSKSRDAAIRRLKRLAADRKLLEKLK